MPNTVVPNVLPTRLIRGNRRCADAEAGPTNTISSEEPHFRARMKCGRSVALRMQNASWLLNPAPAIAPAGNLALGDGPDSLSNCLIGKCGLRW